MFSIKQLNHMFSHINWQKVTKDKCSSRETKHACHLLSLLLFDAHVGGFWMCETRFFQASLQYSIATVQRRLLKTMSQINLHKDRWAVKARWCTSIMTQIRELLLQINLLIFFAKAVYAVTHPFYVTMVYSDCRHYLTMAHTYTCTLALLYLWGYYLSFSPQMQTLLRTCWHIRPSCHTVRSCWASCSLWQHLICSPCRSGYHPHAPFPCENPKACESDDVAYKNVSVNVFVSLF